jgi:HlyD family secretion protein
VKKSSRWVNVLGVLIVVAYAFWMMAPYLRSVIVRDAAVTSWSVRAPPGSIVWSVYVGSGAAVQAGTPVAEWLDCSVLMIDVPVSDAEASLITPGMDAEVVLEGESLTRKASVLRTRGSASTLGRHDLVALAKGRHEGVAQVLLEFPSKPVEFEECPVGRAAYVDFPDIDLIDIIRARLRL